MLRHHLAETEMAQLRDPSNLAMGVASTEAKNILDIIHGGHAVVKMICSPVGDDQSWDLLLPQFDNPASHRPIKPIPTENIDRTRSYHPLQRIWQTRTVNTDRGVSKPEKENTKKTAVILLPTDAKITLFTPINPAYDQLVGLLFDIRECDLKGEKYIFLTNANTNDRWWLKRHDQTEKSQFVMQGVTLEELKAYLCGEQAAGRLPEQNEILACLSKKALKGIFAPCDDLFTRLNALTKQSLIYEKLGIKLPLFILTPETGVKVYTLEQQIIDFQAAEKLEETDPRRILITKQLAIPTYNYLCRLAAERSEAKHPEPLPQVQVMTVTQTKQLMDNADTPIATLTAAIKQLCEANNRGAGELFYDYLNSISKEGLEVRAIEVIKEFIDNKVAIKRRAITFYDPNDDEEDWCSRVFPGRVRNWSVLLQLVLMGHGIFTEAVVKQYPHWSENLLQGLNELIAVAEKTYCPFALKDIKNAKMNVLLQLGQQGVVYQNTHQERRFLEAHLVQSIVALKNIEEIFEFYRFHENFSYLTEHRHGYYDRWRGNLFPEIRHKILLKLYEKLQRGVDTAHTYSASIFNSRRDVGEEQRRSSTPSAGGIMHHHAVEGGDALEDARSLASIIDPLQRVLFAGQLHATKPVPAKALCTMGYLLAKIKYRQDLKLLMEIMIVHRDFLAVKSEVEKLHGIVQLPPALPSPMP